MACLLWWLGIYHRIWTLTSATAWRAACTPSEDSRANRARRGQEHSDEEGYPGIYFTNKPGVWSIDGTMSLENITFTLAENTDPDKTGIKND